MLKLLPFSFLLMLLTAMPYKVLAQNDIFSRFGGVYTVEHGPAEVQFVMYPRGQELHGNITFAGRDYPLQATVDGLTLKAVFGQDGERHSFRMPYSTDARFQVTFAGSEYGSWSFLRFRLPEFAGEFSGEFGRITLNKTGQGAVSGEYVSSLGDEPVPVSAVPHGLEVVLQGPIDGKLFYSLDERRYFAEIDGRFSAVGYKNPSVVAQERQNRVIRDNNAWRRALAKGTEAALEDYRRDWPQGLHVDEIPEVIEQLHWLEVAAAGDFRDFVRHVKRFPNGKLFDRADDGAWAITSVANTDEAYDRYLEFFAGGSYVKAAQNGKDDLAWHRALMTLSIKGYGEYAKAFPQGKQVQTADNAAWDIATKVQSETAFNAYKRAFPGGMHVVKVDAAKANVRAIIADNEAFKLARKRDSKAGYQNYLAEYPDGRNAKKAKAGIAALIAAAEAQKDDAAWRKALAAQSESALNYYTIQWPNGRHVDEVPEVIERLKQTAYNKLDDRAFANAQQVNSLTSYRNYIAQYHDGQHRLRALKAIETFENAAKARYDLLVELQNKLTLLKYFDGPLTGQLDSATKKAINKFQSAMNYAQTGDADDVLLQQLDGVIDFNHNLKSAKQGSAAHMYLVAENYYHGKGAKSDLAQAMKWYHKAADEGHSGAMVRVGYSLVSGQGGQKDLKAGVDWLKKAIRLGEDEGMYQMGLLYLKGVGVRQNSKRGVGWLVRSAEGGNAQAMNYLGDLYAQGKGVKKDEKAANQWYEKAAAQTMAPR